VSRYRAATGEKRRKSREEKALDIKNLKNLQSLGLNIRDFLYPLYIKDPV
jgi:hypothetical protein